MKSSLELNKQINILKSKVCEKEAMIKDLDSTNELVGANENKYVYY